MRCGQREASCGSSAICHSWQSHERLIIGTDAHQYLELEPWSRITHQFFVAHFRGCVILFDNHTLEQDMELRRPTSPRTTHAALVGHLRSSDVVSRSLFRQTPRNGISYFTMMSLHCQNAIAKKRSIALNILLAVRTVLLHEEMDMVAGDFNGASWRRVSGPEQQFDSTLGEAFKNAQLPVPNRLTPLWGAGGIPSEWMTHVGLSSRPGLDRNGFFGNTGHLR